METPKEETKSKKEQGGCVFLIVRGSIAVAIVLGIDYLVSWIFHSAWPHDEVTSSLIPFQNSYLAKTDAFITSEGMTTEFTDDPGAAARFLGRAIFVVVGVFLLFVVVNIIPFLDKLSKYLLHTLALAMLILMADSLFFPPVLTEFDREKKMMIVHKPEWMIFDEKIEIPFNQISGFEYVVERVNGNDFDNKVVNADLYAITPNGKVFIGENQLVRYYHDHDHEHNYNDDPMPVSDEKKAEIERAVEALQKLIK